MRLAGIPDEALALEERALGKRGEPTLFAAFEILWKSWRAGDRSRELGLHLLFLTWYFEMEPPYLTGLDEERVPSSNLAGCFNEVHDYMAPEKSEDPELLYVVGLMARLAPWALGDAATWERRSEQYRASYRRLAPQGLDPSRFDGRGAYGDYFGHQVRVGGGF